MDAVNPQRPRILSHGMNGATVNADAPAPTLDEAARILRQYPQVGPPRRLVWHSPRPFSSGCLLTATNRTVFIKRHPRQVRDVEGRHEEHRFNNHLRARGIAVSEVLATTSGATAMHDDHWTYEVHGVAAGIALYRAAASWTPFITAAHATAAGKALAQLHLAAQNFDAPARKAQLLVSSFTIFSQPNPLPALQAYIEQRPAIAAFLAHRSWRDETVDTLMPFHARLPPI